MAAHLLDILDDIAALPVEVGGVIVPVYYNTTMKNGYEEADLPARVLQITNFEFADVKSVSMRPPFNITIDWIISDILLYRNAGLGRGLGDMAYDVTAYAEMYADLVRTLGTIDWTRANVSGTFPVLEYPAASGKFYNAVVITVHIRDIVKG